MSPRVPGSQPPFTLDQVRLIAESVGLDLDKPLRGQLDPGEQGDDPVARQLAELTQRIDVLTERQQGAPAPEQTFAEGLAGKLQEAQSDWFTPGGEPDAA